MVFAHVCVGMYMSTYSHICSYDPIEATGLYWVSSPIAIQCGFVVCFVLLFETGSIAGPGSD